MKTKKVKTRFMEGNIDVDGSVFDVICDKIGIEKAMNIDFDFDNAIYSNGFISAINSGLVPDFSTIKKSNSNSNNQNDTEYHHVIVDDNCYVVYFN